MKSRKHLWDGPFPIKARCPHCRGLFVIYDELMTVAEKRKWWEDWCEENEKPSPRKQKRGASGRGA